LDALAVPQRRELRIEQVDVGYPIDLGVLDYPSVAISAKAELGPDENFGVLTLPGAAGGESVAWEGPGNAPPAGSLLVAVRLGIEVRERRQACKAGHRAAGQRSL
jgi:hypothetical protein